MRESWETILWRKHPVIRRSLSDCLVERCPSYQMDTVSIATKSSLLQSTNLDFHLNFRIELQGMPQRPKCTSLHLWKRKIHSIHFLYSSDMRNCTWVGDYYWKSSENSLNRVYNPPCGDFHISGKKGPYMTSTALRPLCEYVSLLPEGRRRKVWSPWFPAASCRSVPSLLTLLFTFSQTDQGVTCPFVVQK